MVAVLDLLGQDEAVAAMETAETVETPVSFLEVPFEEYGVTDGLLLVLCILVFLSFLGGLLGRCFSWL